jgi:hypothetical protein
MSGRWGQGLTAAKMAECRWLNPVLVGQFEFVEWTPDLAAAIQKRFAITAHPRSIERALGRQEKKRR